MKKTFILKYLLLMISLTFLYTTPAFASAGAIVGSVDVFNGTQISGWAYETASPLSSPDILLKITNTVTGETVSEIPAKPDSKRNDLVSQVGEEGTPAFTATVDLSNLADGTYSAAAYKDGQKFTNSVYYTKGNAAAATDGRTAHLLGTFRLTAYCPCRSCSEGWGRHTSSGAIAAAGHTVAVDPRVIPIGSKLMINGTVYTAEDVGGGVKGRHVDLFFDTHAQTRQFGSQMAEVYLIQ